MDKSISDRYEPVIGLEVHAQLLTKSKIYSPDPVSFGAAPNTQVGVITLAHPGTMPKLNKLVIELAIKMGLACHCDISRYQIFDRKNYFYPDSPKGYQLTQDRTPICKNGYITISTEDKRDVRVQLNRIHIEEDAGKSIHAENGDDSLIDLNRSGVPLIEIVTEPVIRSAEEAGALLAEVRKIVRYLDICDGNMEEGSLRCDANISLRRKGAKDFGTKVEVKNMNSIRNVQRAIEFEIDRQIVELESGNTPVSETRTFDANTGATSSMRTKEELNDYRYFPDPDLSPLTISEEWLAEIKSAMPVLPETLFQKFVNEFRIPEYDARVLTENREVAQFFQALCGHTPNFKAASNWIMGPVQAYLNEKGISISELKLNVRGLAELIGLVENNMVSFSNAAQRILPALIDDPDANPTRLATVMNLIQENDEGTLIMLIEEVLGSNPSKVQEYKKGKKGLISMFMGEVMKKSKGKADPKLTTDLLQKKLSEL